MNAQNTTSDRVFWDNKEYVSMIEVWKKFTGENNPRCCNCLRDEDIVGGHVVELGKSSELKRNDEVFIVPLCKKCNHHTNSEIQLAQDTKAVSIRWDGCN